MVQIIYLKYATPASASSSNIHLLQSRRKTIAQDKVFFVVVAKLGDAGIANAKFYLPRLMRACCSRSFKRTRSKMFLVVTGPATAVQRQMKRVLLVYRFTKASTLQRFLEKENVLGCLSAVPVLIIWLAAAKGRQPNRPRRHPVCPLIQAPISAYISPISSSYCESWSTLLQLLYPFPQTGR